MIFDAMWQRMETDDRKNHGVFPGEAMRYRCYPGFYFPDGSTAKRMTCEKLYDPVGQNYSTAWDPPIEHCANGVYY